MSEPDNCRSIERRKICTYISCTKDDVMARLSSLYFLAAWVISMGCFMWALAIRALRGREAHGIFILAFLLPMLALGYLLHTRYVGGASQMRHYSPFVFMGARPADGQECPMEVRRGRMAVRESHPSDGRQALAILLLATTGNGTRTDLQRLLGVSISVNGG